MSTAIATFVAVAATLCGLAYLVASDPKRRRAHKLPPGKRRFAIPALALVFGPGCILAIFGMAPAFVLWLSAACLSGWVFALRPPRSRAKTAGP